LSQINFAPFLPVDRNRPQLPPVLALAGIVRAAAPVIARLRQAMRASEAAP